MLKRSFITFLQKARILLILSPIALFAACESNDAILFPVNDPGSTPVLLVPSNNSTLSTITPVFDWVDIQQAVSYNFQLSSDASFDNMVLDTSGFSSSSFTVPGGILDDSSSYYWRVNAFLTQGDTSDWSASFSFNVVLSSISPTKKVFVELFTNTSCIPCVETNHYLDDIYRRLGITVNDADVVILRTHTTLFAGDPFYEFNPADNAARMNYYNAASVNPRGFLLGSNLGPYSSANWTNRLNERLNNFRSFAIVLENSYNSSNRTGDVSIKVKQESGSNISDLVLHVAVVENDISYNAPNGETIFDNTLRDLLTSSGGQPVSISAGQTNTYEYSYILSPVINENNTDITVFVQSVSTKEVFAVEIIKVN